MGTIVRGYFSRYNNDKNPKKLSIFNFIIVSNGLKAKLYTTFVTVVKEIKNFPMDFVYSLINSFRMASLIHCIYSLSNISIKAVI